MKKRSIIDHIEISRDGTINVRIAKEVLDGDGTVLISAWHRTVCPPGSNIDAQMQAVNANLHEMKCASVGGTCIARLKAHAATAWTEEVKRDHQAKVEDALKMRAQ